MSTRPASPPATATTMTHIAPRSERVIGGNTWLLDALKAYTSSGAGGSAPERKTIILYNRVLTRNVGRKITRIPHPLPALVLAHGLARPCPPGRTFPGGVAASQRLQPRHV